MGVAIADVVIVLFATWLIPNIWPL